MKLIDIILENSNKHPKKSKLKSSFLKENEGEGPTGFSNWVRPSDAKLDEEFRREHEMKGNQFWRNKDSFLKAVKRAKVVTITPEIDQTIDYRSSTSSYDDLLNLIKKYRSYPEFRNENTLKNLYKRFMNNEEMDYPIVVQFPNKSLRVFSGNTRMDVAFQLKINPEVLLVKTDYSEYGPGFDDDMSF
jgi:hypothetical protein